MLAVAAVLLVVVLATPRVSLPITGSFGPEQSVVARLDLGLAAVVLCVLAGALLLLPATTVIGQSVALIGHSVTLSVTVFLVARMNGIADVAALVPLYALTSAMVLFVVLQSRLVVRLGHPLLALCLGAGVGIVPWGVIAFVQIDGIIVGEGPPVMVRVITLVALSGAVLWFLAVWRVFRQNPPLLPNIAGSPGVVSAATSGVFAIVVVAGVVSQQILIPG